MWEWVLAFGKEGGKLQKCQKPLKIKVFDEDSRVPVS